MIQLFTSLFIFRGHNTRICKLSVTMSSVTWFILRVHTGSCISHNNTGRVLERFWIKTKVNGPGRCKFARKKSLAVDDPFQVLKGEPPCFAFSTDGSLLSVSAVPHCVHDDQDDDDHHHHHHRQLENNTTWWECHTDSDGFAGKLRGAGIACWWSAGLMIERLRVRIPAGAAGEISSAE